MAENKEKFLEAEESAEQILQALQTLHEQASNYHDAANELNAVRAELITLIEATQELSKGSLEAVQTLKSIGGPEIMERLDLISQQSAENGKRVARLQALVVAALLLCGIGVAIGVIAVFK